MDEHQFMDISKLMHCGVYALVRKGQVVYVGKSKEPLRRIFRHVSNRGKPMGQRLFGGYTSPAQDGKGITFDTIWFLPCMLGQLGTLEVHFIKMFMPKHNVKHNPDLKAKTTIMPIPDDIRALLAQMVTITGLPQEDSPKVYIRRML